MNKLNVAPINSPTLDGMEMQSKTSLVNTQNKTTTTTAVADSSTTTVGPVKTSVHVTALDGIVNVNSLFTMATFIDPEIDTSNRVIEGYDKFSYPSQTSGSDDVSNKTTRIEENLEEPQLRKSSRGRIPRRHFDIEGEAFMIAPKDVPEAATAASRAECTASRETVKRLIVFEVISFSFFLFSSLIAQSINLVNNMDPTDPHKADINPNLLKYGLFGSAIGSLMGCSFLMLSIVDFIQVKLGVFSCGGKPVYALVTLVLFVGSGLVVYVSTAIYAAFFVEVSSKDTSTTNQTQN
ncbi:hypothetical protein BUALT_Bualt02G0167800 [Buddleja alternifolia]|uniref:Uncharacterized protein n=1 Tax=Buddleja alternifolia TaxID=168488 RepID=A0AAV6Y7Y9_9LAMI|nr:hypothetical protein BUALT_Bualt02G0167800 [Buddleja alternifolia]